MEHQNDLKQDVRSGLYYIIFVVFFNLTVRLQQGKEGIFDRFNEQHGRVGFLILKLSFSLGNTINSV